MCVSWQYTAAAAISRFVGEGGLLGRAFAERSCCPVQKALTSLPFAEL
jgi:hypothetical protein